MKTRICHRCGKETKGIGGKSFYIDHNHKTGKVRGVLCNKCNTAIGMLQESPEIILSAYQYIKEDYDSQ